MRNDLKLPLNSIEVLKKRYLLKDDRQNIIESPSELFFRVAHNTALAEDNFKSKITAEEAEENFYNMMHDLDFLPNSPTLMNAGTSLGQLSACFVLPVADSIDGIFNSLKDMARIHQTGGGTGFSFSNIRPKGDLVRSTKGAASGPISFMAIFDTATGVIVQGGRRRGANMGIMRCDHPDILEFIDSKLDEKRFANFNISVGVTDRFMEAARKEEEYDLVNPRTKRVARTVNARVLFERMAKAAWTTGDPGMIFLDEINRRNPTPAIGRIEATNPCLSGDNWIMTSQGPRKIRELIAREFSIVIDGESYSAHKRGFFSTGTRPAFRLITKEGHELEATANHLILKIDCVHRYDIRTNWASLGDLKRGDKIFINNHRDFKGWPGKYGKREGYLIGLLLGDGALTPERAILFSWTEMAGQEGMRNLAYKYISSFPHRGDFGGWVSVKKGVVRLSTSYLKELAYEVGLTPGRKSVTKIIERSSFRFYQGFLKGLFDTDGTVIGTQSKGVSVRLSQSDLGILQAVQRMLLRIGIVSRIYKDRRPAGHRKMPDGKGGHKNYFCKSQHELVIANENILYFAKKIGFADSKKAKKLKGVIKKYKRKMNRERFMVTVDRIISIGKKETYDICIPGINKFDANGLIVHNCGELPLLPYESCNLASINLARMVSSSELDWAKLKTRVEWGIRFLDDVIEVNKFPLPEIKKITFANRKIGLGVMGFADMLIRLGIPYDSKEAADFAGKLMGFIHRESLAASMLLARERGVFPNFKRSVYARRNMRLRNATVNTIAPTGTISIIAGCSSGIEPLFAISYIRNVLSGTKLFEVNPLFKETAAQRGLYTKGILDAIAKAGSLENIKAIPKDMKRIFLTSFDLTPEKHLLIQAAFQRQTDNSVSKTINLPADASTSDVKKVYLAAYQLRLKGITVYRYGTKDEQVLSFGKKRVSRPLAASDLVTAESEYSGGCAIGTCPF